MSLFSCFQISSSGMSVERKRLEIIADNIANANTTKTAQGELYRRKILLTAASPACESGFMQTGATGKGVREAGVVEDNNPPRLVYDPGNPQADQSGFVQYPNFDIVNEMINLITATRTYQANLSVFSEAKNMMLNSLEIGK